MVRDFGFACLFVIIPAREFCYSIYFYLWRVNNMKYEKLSKDILELIGGKENVNSVFHCVTRLRFKLKDESIAKTEEIKNLDGVVTVMKSGGQYQVVIRNHVPDVYAAVL